MKLPDKVYDTLKWICLVFLPCFSTFFYALDHIFGWQLAGTVCGVIAAVTAFIGGLLGVSTAQYNKEVKA